LQYRNLDFVPGVKNRSTTKQKSSGPLWGPNVKHRGKNCPDLATIANIRFALAVLTMWLKPVTASSNVSQMLRAASCTTVPIGRT